MTKNVLIITQSFPPLGNIAARRFGFLVPHMESLGWRPWILTMDGPGPLRVALPGEQILRIGRHPQAAGVSGDTRIVDTPRRGLSPAVDRIRRAAAQVGIRLRAVDYTCFTWYREVVSERKTITSRLPKIDLVLGTFGPAASLWLARRFARQWNVPWVADFRDLAALRPDGRRWYSRRLDGQIEHHLLRSAAGITTVSPTLAAILSETHGRPTEVIYNGWNDAIEACDTEPLSNWVPGTKRSGVTDGLTTGPPLRHGPGTPRFDSGTPRFDSVTLNAGRNHSPPYLYYAGRWYPERERAGRLVLEVLAQRPDLRWLIRSLGPASAEENLRAEIARRGLADRVDLCPACEPGQVQREADRALANLVLDDVDCRERWSRGTLTGKLLELVAARPAVLAVTRPDSDIGPILRETSKGQVCPDVETLDRFVAQLQKDIMTCSGDRQAVKKFSKSRQAAVLCHFFNQLTSPIPNP